jgi:hypothetical protein
MENLREIRNNLLSLHKLLMDIERENYEAAFGRVSNLELLNLLFEHPNFRWLRELSGLVAEIDELFAAKTGFDGKEAAALFQRVQSLFDESDQYEDFKARFKANLDTERRVAERQEVIMRLLENEKA